MHLFLPSPMKAVAIDDPLPMKLKILLPTAYPPAVHFFVPDGVPRTGPSPTEFCAPAASAAFWAATNFDASSCVYQMHLKLEEVPAAEAVVVTTVSDVTAVIGVMAMIGIEFPEAAQTIFWPTLAFV